MVLWAAQIVLLCGVDGFAHAQKRPATVADSIEAQSFGTPLDEALSKPPAIFSPKHDRFVVVMRRGLIASNVNRYSLILFQVDALMSGAAPIHLLDMDSSSIDPAIDMVQWSPDGESLLFLGEVPGQSRQLYRFDFRGRRLHQLTRADTSVMTYAVTADRSTLVFLTKPPLAPTLDAKRTDALIVSGQTLPSLLGNSEDSGALQRYRLFVQKRSETPKEVSLGGMYPDLDNGITVSPDGKHATVALLAEDRPEAWGRYKFPSWMRWIVRYFLVDTASGHIEPLLDAPSSNWRPELAWSSTSESVVIAGTYLPLDATEFRPHVPEPHQAVVEVQVNHRRLTLIADKPFHLVQWNAQEQRLILQDEDGGVPPAIYQKSEDTWIMRGPWNDADSSAPSVDIREDQGMNQPSRLVAVDRKTGEKKVIFDPNPQFAALTFGDVKEIEWKTADGHAGKGGLYLPVNYVSGKRYPLVIQTHGWSKAKFWMDGPSTAGYAAQELAGRGFVVAQVEGPIDVKGWQSTPQEGPLLMSMVEGLIDDLDRKGLVDRSRVGILGWSRSAYLTRYTLAFSRYSFRAAVLADGYDDGYFHYLSRLNLGKAEAAEYERMVGAAPFGDGLKTWLRNSTAFNLDGVRAPVRILGFSPSSLLANWEWFAGLKHLGKPVEFVWIPNAGHVPMLPTDRLLAQEGDVDWFDFWLNGFEDPNPLKREQYLRWEGLKEKQGQSASKSQAAP
jgi:dipeptidyl aminopeptidase/acylaminoacyl peptidase